MDVFGEAPSRDGDAPGAAPDPFALLYDRLAGRLYGAARALGCTGPEAEDIVHDLFVRLVQSGAAFGEVADPEAYAFTSLRHAVYRLRQRSSLERHSLARISHARPEGMPPAAPVPGIDGDRLRAALAALPEAQREVVTLKIDGGLTFAQIARVTNVSLNTAAGRWRYALDKLRAALSLEEVR